VAADPTTARVEGPRASLAGFTARLLVIAVFVCLGLVLWRLRDLVALGFGALVLAVGFRGIADALARRAHIPKWLALAGAVALCLGVTAVTLEVFGSAMMAQYGELSRRLPQSAHTVAAQRSWSRRASRCNRAQTARRRGSSPARPGC
jgi:predicted PurR-regulated permease PerM